MLKKNPNIPNLHIVISKSEDQKSRDLGQNPTLRQHCSTQPMGLCHVIGTNFVIGLQPGHHITEDVTNLSH